MLELTAQDIDILIDALDAFEEKEKTHFALSGIMKSILLSNVRGNPEADEFVRNEKIQLEQEREEMEIRQKNIRERNILLKAKLIQMKDKVGVNNLIAGK